MNKLIEKICDDFYSKIRCRGYDNHECLALVDILRDVIGANSATIEPGWWPIETAPLDSAPDLTADARTSDLDLRRHFYALSFAGDSLDHGVRCNAVVYMAYSGSKDITMSRIKKAKREARVRSDAVLLSASYLGFMTMNQFYQIDEAK